MLKQARVSTLLDIMISEYGRYRA